MPVSGSRLHQGLCRRCIPRACRSAHSPGRECPHFRMRLRESARVVVKGRQGLHWSADPTGRHRCLSGRSSTCDSYMCVSRPKWGTFARCDGDVAERKRSGRTSYPIGRSSQKAALADWGLLGLNPEMLAGEEEWAQPCWASRGARRGRMKR